METLFVIYDEMLDPHITGIIERDMVVARYTRIDEVVGARMAEQEQDTGYVSDRRNRIIMVIAEPPAIARLVSDLRALRAREGHGLRGFVVPASQVI